MTKSGSLQVAGEPLGCPVWFSAALGKYIPENADQTWKIANQCVSKGDIVPGDRVPLLAWGAGELAITVIDVAPGGVPSIVAANCVSPVRYAINPAPLVRAILDTLREANLEDCGLRVVNAAELPPELDTLRARLKALGLIVHTQF